jgi:hypothetical protein
MDNVRQANIRKGPTGSGADKANLILVTGRGAEDWRDFEKIAHEVVRLAPDIAVQLVSPRETAATVAQHKWQRRSITVCVGHAGNFVPLRGPLFQNAPIKKLDQYSRLKSAGIATPHTERFEFGREYSEALFGEFVILKPLPLELTSKGSSAKLYRTRRLPQLRQAEFPEDHFLHKAPGLVQSFVDTGEYVSKWRVLTLFGEPLYSSTSVSMLPRADLGASDAEIESSAIEPRNIRNREADTTGTRDRLARDDEILAFARQVHAVFPTLPVLGCDVLRRQPDGKLFALEINGGGNVWHFSSYADKHRARLGGRESMVAQFGAWTVAAKSLIRMVRQYAA